MTRKKYRPQRDDSMLGDSDPVSGTGSESGVHSAPVPVPVPAPVPVPVSHSDDEGNVIIDVGNHSHFIPVVICELEESSAGNVPEPVPEPEIPPSCASDAPCSGCAEVAETSNIGCSGSGVPVVSAIANTNDGIGADTSADAEVGSKTDAVVAKVVDGIVDNVVLAAASAPPPSSKWSWARIKNWVSGCCSFCCCCRRKRRTSVQLK